VTRHRWAALAATALGLALGLAVHATLAASVLDFDRWMRRVDRTSVSVQRSIARRDDAAALADARQIEDLYAQMEAFFSADGQPGDAARMSREGRLLAATMAGAIEKQDYDAALRAATGITRACSDCHEHYRPFN
jgi:hypothetical protein